MTSSRSPLKFVSDTVKKIPRSGIRDFFDIVSSMPDTISLGVGEPGFQTPWHIRDASIYALEKGATGYTSNLGLPELRRAISQYVSQFFSLSYDPDHEILVTTGVSEALDLAIRAVINPGDEVIFHEPSYVSYRPVIQLAHGRPVGIETRQSDDFRLVADEVSERITSRTRVLMLNFPNNPTGAGLYESDLEALAELVTAHDLLVISDEIYGELTYERPHKSLISFPGMKERSVFLHGLSKAWAMTGFRLGYSCAPRPLTEAMMTIHQYTMLCAPTLSQHAGVEAFRRADKDVPEMRDLYRRNRNFIHQSLDEMGLPLHLAQGAFYAFPRVSQLGMSSREFALKLLEEEKVAVVPGEAFGACGEGFVRCSFATSLEDIKVAMERMARFVSKRSR